MNSSIKICAVLAALIGTLSRFPDASSQTNGDAGSMKEGVNRRALNDGAQFSSQSLNGRWEGLLSGNDPEAKVVLDLDCADDDSVTGKLVWTSQHSGSNTRQLSGFFERKDGTVILKDDKLLFTRAKQLWYFCPIERYQLQISPDGRQLEGSYTAPRCHDKGSVKLHRPTSEPSGKSV
jgi:hypothetical protein